MTDVEKLIRAARCCTSGGEGCDKCPMNDYIGKCNLARHSLTAHRICEIADYYEAELKKTEEIFEAIINAPVDPERRGIEGLLREDIRTLQMTLQIHKEVIEDYKVRLAAERGKVAQAVREWAKEAVFTDSWGMPAIYLYQITEKLDSMERGKGESE